MNKVVYISVGGTGIRVLRSLVYASAVGIFKDVEFNYIIIDQDVNNGNVKEVSGLIDEYEKIKSFGFKEIFTTEFKKLSQEKKVLSLTTQEKLGDFISQYEDNNPLYKLLYTEKEREFELREGFRGLPNIGSLIVLSSEELINNQEFKDFLRNQSNVNVVICGSVFGGTGASCLPTLPGEIRKINPNPDVKIFGIFYFPYFKVDKRTEESENIRPIFEIFGIKSTLSLYYYSTLGKDENKVLPYDSIVLLGLPEEKHNIIGNYGIGGDSQKNRPHFLEFISALVIKNLIQKGESLKGKVIRVGLKGGEGENYFNLYDEEIKDDLIKLDSFLLSSLALDLDYESEKTRIRSLGVKNLEKLEQVKNFCKSRFESYYISIRFSNNKNYKNKDDFENKFIKMVKEKYKKQIDEWLNKAFFRSKGKEGNQYFEELFKAIKEESPKIFEKEV